MWQESHSANLSSGMRHVQWSSCLWLSLDTLSLSQNRKTRNQAILETSCDMWPDLTVIKPNTATVDNVKCIVYGQKPAVGTIGLFLNVHHFNFYVKARDMDHARYQIDSFFGQSLIHTDNTTLTTSCGHQAPVVVSDVYDLNKFPRVDLKSKHILQCGGLQASHVGEKLKQQHLCCTDDVVTLFETKLAPDDDSLEHMHRYLPTFLVPPFLLQILKKLQCS